MRACAIGGCCFSVVDVLVVVWVGVICWIMCFYCCLFVCDGFGVWVCSSVWCCVLVVLCLIFAWSLLGWVG